MEFVDARRLNMATRLVTSISMLACQATREIWGYAKSMEVALNRVPECYSRSMMADLWAVSLEVTWKCGLAESLPRRLRTKAACGRSCVC